MTYSLGSATWAITSGNGNLSPSSGAQSTFTAGDVAGSVTITATGSGCSARITFTVVEPSSWTMRRAPGTNVGHTHGRPDCSWYGTMKIHPNTVNFYRIETRELNSTITMTGSYNIPAWRGATHQPRSQTASAFFSIIDHSDAEGSEVGMRDNISTSDPGPAATGTAPPFNPGTHSFPITWQWTVLGSGAIHDFPQQRHEGEIFANGRCEMRKGGNAESTMYSDPTSTR
ncbi:MAG: hypothetical protein PHE55_03220 [Methylococcaceae bacterium]|nr:hypothetical protein [Methylococcaceae bacterium]